MREYAAIFTTLNGAWMKICTAASIEQVFNRVETEMEGKYVLIPTTPIGKGLTIIPVDKIQSVTIEEYNAE